jgi:hypothetical protein
MNLVYKIELKHNSMFGPKFKLGLLKKTALEIFLVPRIGQS